MSQNLVNSIKVISRKLCWGFMLTRCSLICMKALRAQVMATYWAMVKAIPYAVISGFLCSLKASPTTSQQITFLGSTDYFRSYYCVNVCHTGIIFCMSISIIWFHCCCMSFICNCFIWLCNSHNILNTFTIDSQKYLTHLKEETSYWLAFHTWIKMSSMEA